MEALERTLETRQSVWQKSVFETIQKDVRIMNLTKLDTLSPQVNFRESVTRRAEFDYLHKKQSGGQGQFGRVMGYLEPLPRDHPKKVEFVNEIIGQVGAYIPRLMFWIRFPSI